MPAVGSPFDAALLTVASPTTPFYPLSSPCVLSPWQIIAVPDPVVQRMLPVHYPYSTSAQYYQ